MRERFPVLPASRGCFPGGSSENNLPANVGNIKDAGSIPGQEDPLEKGMATHSSILPGESHGQSSLMGYSP